MGTELADNVSYAKIATACGLLGEQVFSMTELKEKLLEALENQMTKKQTTFLEVLLNQELGEPFRRDAMRKPVEVQGVNNSDMENHQHA